MDEKLIVGTALAKVVNTLLKDEKAENLETMEALYGQANVTQRALLLKGRKVGTVSYVPPKIKIALPLDDRAALRELEKRGLTEVVPVKGWESRFEVVGDFVFDRETGEECDWLMAVPTRGYATVRGCALDEVREALGDGSVLGLLEE